MSFLLTEVTPGVATFELYVPPAIDPPLSITSLPNTGSGDSNIFNLTADTRLVVATIPSFFLVTAVITPPDDFPVGVPLKIVLTNDPGSTTFGFYTASFPVDGAPSATFAANESRTLVFDGSGWWTAATGSTSP